MWAVSDDALLAGLAAGDREAAAEFVARFQRRVFGLALRLTGDPRAAEDVAQEAFVRAWRHAGVFDSSRGSVATWLSTITRNLAIDALRVRRPAPLAPDAVVELERVLPGSGFDDAVAGRIDAARVRAALDRLPEEQRRAVVLASMYAYSAREISEIEGIPLGTAKTRIRTGLGRLRVHLAESEAGE